MRDTRHETVKEIVNSVFSTKAACLLMEDMLSNHIHQHGDETFFDDDFLDELERVAKNVTEISKRMKTTIAESHHKDYYYRD